ncbi:hypothetical protein [Cupriavidus sp. USMAHM13]|uniref:hypothetical protein n=1 Tax=Cupriavidus sp. USMAHM13 TaxID=1389192 RepID=UPI0012EA8C5D|nr:hypothetical protein [Cupriavidus sp. USMAHM13]
MRTRPGKELLAFLFLVFLGLFFFLSKRLAKAAGLAYYSPPRNTKRSGKASSDAGCGVGRVVGGAAKRD